MCLLFLFNVVCLEKGIENSETYNPNWQKK